EKIDHADAAEAALEQLADRQRLAPLVHRDDDLVDVVLLRVPQQMDRSRNDPLVLEPAAVARRRNEADDLERSLVAAPAQLQQARRAAPGTIAQYPPAKRLVVDELAEEDARRAEQPEAERAADEQDRAVAADRVIERDERQA